MQNHLVIFAKEPRIGRVKTRLAREIGHVAAWQFYRTMVSAIVRHLTRKGPWQVWIAISPDEAPKKSFNLPNSFWIKQGNGDLGARMMAPAQCLPAGRFIVIGTDVPGIEPTMIRKAFKMLGQKDVVFGPAKDGGFWLVGLKRHPILAKPYHKNPVRWSHQETLQDCLKNLKDKKVGFIDELYDIDTKADLLSWRQDR